MTANELADKLDMVRIGLTLEAATMLRQQQAEIELLSSDNKHYRNMAVDFLRCREPYGWHCFIGKGKEKQDFLFINGKGASKPDASWDKVIPLYTHPVKEQLTDEKIDTIVRDFFGEVDSFYDFRLVIRRCIRKAQE